MARVPLMLDELEDMTDDEEIAILRKKLQRYIDRGDWARKALMILDAKTSTKK